MIATKFRLQKNEIEYLLRKGDSFNSGLFIVRHKKNNEDFNKFCVIISRKIDKSAVKRNLLKRRVLEAVRLKEKKGEIGGISIVLIPKQGILEKKVSDIKQDIEKIWENLKKS